MRQSVPDRTIRLQHQFAYSYKGKDIYRSWVSIPAYVIKALGLEKGDELTMELVPGGVLMKKAEKKTPRRSASKRP
jgi:hypothetical protein